MIETQLNSSSSTSQQPMTPEDEQRARMEEEDRTLDLLDSEYQLQQSRLNLLEQTGGLQLWLRNAAALSEGLPTGALNH